MPALSRPEVTAEELSVWRAARQASATAAAAGRIERHRAEGTMTGADGPMTGSGHQSRARSGHSQRSGPAAAGSAGGAEDDWEAAGRSLRLMRKRLAGDMRVTRHTIKAEDRLSAASSSGPRSRSSADRSGRAASSLQSRGEQGVSPLGSDTERLRSVAMRRADDGVRASAELLRCRHEALLCSGLPLSVEPQTAREWDGALSAANQGAPALARYMGKSRFKLLQRQLNGCHASGTLVTSLFSPMFAARERYVVAHAPRYADRRATAIASMMLGAAPAQQLLAHHMAARSAGRQHDPALPHSPLA